MLLTKTTRFNKDLFINLIAVLATVLIILVLQTLQAYALTSLWDLKLGNRTVATFTTKEEAQAVIDGVEKAYTSKDGKVVSIDMEPALTVKEKEYRNKDIGEIADVDDSVKSLTNCNRMKVFVETLKNEEEEIEFKTTEEKTKKLKKGETKVYRDGENGCDSVEYKVVTVNGKYVSREEMSRETVKEPTDKVILVGTKEKQTKKKSSRSSRRAEAAPVKDAGRIIASGNGGAVASYARQFVGGRYVRGGSSLTNGCDCSGFVMAVYKNFGISLPHGSYAMRHVGKGVSLSEAVPGDIICQAGHVGLYIGGGQMVHAVNPRMGIAITDVHYTGSVLAVRRVIG